MIQTQKDIWYESFDNEGLKVERRVLINMGINIASNETQTESNIIYLPFNDTINLSDSEVLQLFVDYIYDTTGVNIGSFKNVEKYQSLNGLPFLLKIDEGDEVFRFQLAFGKLNGTIVIRNDLNIQSLGNIQEINGDLGFIETSISSLGNLKKVNGSIWVAQRFPFTNIATLDNLEEVGNDLNLKGTPIQKLNKLKRVGGTLNLRKTDIQSLGELQYVGNHIYLPATKKDVFDFSKIEIKGKIKYYAN